MMLQHKSLAAFAALIGASQAQVMAVCDGLKAPEWDSCESLRAEVGIALENSAMVGVAGTGNPDDCRNKCFSWHGSGNCAIGWCYTDSCHYEGTGDSFRDVNTYYTIVNTYCVVDPPGGGPADDGGHAPGDSHWGTYVWANFDNDWPPPLARTTLSNDIVEEIWTYDDFQAHLNESSAIAAREVGHVQDKRQDSVTIVSISLSTRRPSDRHQASNVLSSGVEETWNFETSISIGVEVSVSISASFFSLFTAEAGISASMEQTESVSNGMSFTVGECDSENGVVYWHPLYDHYWIQDGNGEFYDIWIPVGLNGAAAGQWETECLR